MQQKRKNLLYLVSNFTGFNKIPFLVKIIFFVLLGRKLHILCHHLFNLTVKQSSHVKCMRVYSLTSLTYLGNFRVDWTAYSLLIGISLCDNCGRRKYPNNWTVPLSWNNSFITLNYSYLGLQNKVVRTLGSIKSRALYNFTVLKIDVTKGSM